MHILSGWKSDKRFYIFLLIVSLYVGIVFIGADFYKNPSNGFKDFILLGLQWSVLLLASFGLLLLLSLNRYVFAVSFPVFVFILSLTAYFKITVGTDMSAVIWNVSLHNDIRTDTDLVSFSLVIFVLINLIIAFCIAVYRYKKISVKYGIYYLVVAIIIMYITNFSVASLRQAVRNHLPYNIYYSYIDYLNDKKISLQNRIDQTAGAVCNEDSLTVVYIQGESLRADHLHINNYNRETTPLTEKENVFSFAHVYSPYTDTDESVPYILTDADSAHPNHAYEHKSFISFFKKNNFETYWIANQQPTESFYYFAKEADSLIVTNAGKTVYNFDPYNWTDEETVQPLQKILSERNGQNTFVLIHSIGSHWWYKAHYTKNFEKFTPVIHSRIVSSNTLQEMINTYDNTILYTDYFIDSVINLLKNKKAVLIYLSDHGEALGENGKWLHATEAAPIHNPACLVWLSDKYKKENPSAEKMLRLNETKYFNTSFLFPSMLDAAHIYTSVSDTTQSIFHNN